MGNGIRKSIVGELRLSEDRAYTLKFIVLTALLTGATSALCQTLLPSKTCRNFSPLKFAETATCYQS